MMIGVLQPLCAHGRLNGPDVYILLKMGKTDDNIFVLGSSSL